MDLEQQLRAALSPSKPDARVRAAVMARVSTAAKQASGSSRSRGLFGTILVALAAAAMLATYLLRSPPQPASASALSPAPAEPVVAAAEKPAEQADMPVMTVPEEVAAPEETKPLPLLLPPRQRMVVAPPNDAAVERAMVARYPELVNGPETNTFRNVYIALKADGSLSNSSIFERVPGVVEARPAIADVVQMNPLTVGRSTRIVQKGTTLADGSVLKAPVMLIATALPEGYDETRTVDLVQKAMVSAHPELLLPVGAETFNQVTVFMTDDGKIDKYYVKNGPRGNLRPYGDIVPEKFASQWEPLGLNAEQLGLMGITTIMDTPTPTANAPAASPTAAAPGESPVAGLVSRLLAESRAASEARAAGAPAPAPAPPDAAALAARAAEVQALARAASTYSSNLKSMVVRYAWPRREGEPIGGYKDSIQPTSLSSGGAAFSHAEASAVIDHYLPGALTDTGTVAMGRPWLLMNRQGEVVRSGYLPVARGEYQRIDAQFMEKQVTDQRIGEVLQMTVVRKYGAAFINQMIFAWVAPDAAGN